MSEPGKSFKVLLSGRFDPPHCGHWLTVLRLLAKYQRVVIVVLDYPERKHPAPYAAQIFQETLDRSQYAQRVQVLINKTHFARITLEELKSFGCDIYAAGNMEVLNHIDSLGFPILYVDRAYDYEASNYVPKYDKMEG